MLKCAERVAESKAENLHVYTRAVLNIQRIATLLLPSLALVSAIPAPELSRRQGACFSSPSKETGLTETSINLVSVAADEKDAHWVSAISDDRGGVDVGAWNIDNDQIQIGLSYTPLLGQSSQNFVLTVWDEDGYDEVWRKVFDGQGTYCVTTENLKKSEIQVSLTWA